MSRPERQWVTDATRRLIAERKLTEARISSLTHDFDAIVAAARDTATDDEHDPEGQTIAFERAQVSALLDQARDQISRVDHATARLADGSYATCAQCGRPIGHERLEARPTATTCVACAVTTGGKRGGR